MSKESKSIYNFDINLIHEYYSLIERQGPGSPEMTIRALSFIEGLSEYSKIADIGCGTGGQTMVLAKHIPGIVTGIDRSDRFIDLFNRNAGKANLQHRVKGIVGSMEDLPFQKEELDLIWSEGAIFCMGFERGLNEWYHFLKKGGFIAVTEATWFTEKRPAEIEDFWQAGYPEIDTIPNKLAQMQKAGYVPVAAFVLPENCWTEHFYAPQLAAQEEFLRTHAGNRMAEEYIAFERYEQALYVKYKAHYGYAFYIGKKI
ncbi:MAG: methyltransferase domain-containing protein [Bacteroidales bacterium]|nr:methyltransferase domain-containing protein [Bacteroidales bacterium]